MWRILIRNTRPSGSKLLQTRAVLTNHIPSPTVLTPVRNNNKKLCAFVPHSPEEFWTELTRNYPEVQRIILEEFGQTFPDPRQSVPQDYNVLQVSVHPLHT